MRSSGEFVEIKFSTPFVQASLTSGRICEFPTHRSRAAPVSVDRKGFPCDIDSRRGSPNPSITLGESNPTEEEYRLDSSLSDGLEIYLTPISSLIDREV